MGDQRAVPQARGQVQRLVHLRVDHRGGMQVPAAARREERGERPVILRRGAPAVPARGAESVPHAADAHRERGVRQAGAAGGKAVLPVRMGGSTLDL